jgi:hypothetical protein
MRPPFNLILSIIFLLFSGRVHALQTKQNKPAENLVFHAVLADSADETGSNFHCNNFVADAFTGSFRLKTLLKNKNDFFNISKQPIINMHDSTIVDTAFNFSNKKNEISIYKASHAELINKIDITDKRFVLKGSISIGMSKANFKNRFDIKTLESDTIVISDEDNIVRFTFYFKKNALVRITYKALID